MSKSVTRLPGKKEAKEILEDMYTAQDGIFAWVRAGIRLAYVKRDLPHGKFSGWLDSNFSHVRNLSQSHFYRAKRVAEQILEHIHTVNDRATPYPIEEVMKMLESEDGQIARIIIGKSQRQLTMNCEDFTPTVDEAAAQMRCKEIWAADPELRDQFEPDAICGEVSYISTYNSMMRKEESEGKKRSPVKYGTLIQTNFRGLIRNTANFKKLSKAEKDQVIDDAIEFGKSCPPELAKVLAPLLKQK